MTILDICRQRGYDDTESLKYVLEELSKVDIVSFADVAFDTYAADEHFVHFDVSEFLYKVEVSGFYALKHLDIEVPKFLSENELKKIVAERL